jgi:hypothetical protein
MSPDDDHLQLKHAVYYEEKEQFQMHSYVLIYHTT